MKKALLSLAVIAASGAYVVYQNHAEQSSSTDAAAMTLPAEGKVTGWQLDGAVDPSSDSIPSAKPKATAEAPIAATATPTQSVTAASSASVAANFFSVPSPLSSSQATPARAVSAPSVAVAEIAPAQAASPAHQPSESDASSVPLPLPRPAFSPAGAATEMTAQAAVGFHDGTFEGGSANAYYGRVQVDAVIKGGQLVTVKILDYPSDRRTSRSINSRALPDLEQEAIQAQSAAIDAVST